jgi:hypothetical protein
MAGPCGRIPERDAIRVQAANASCEELFKTLNTTASCGVVISLKNDQHSENCGAGATEFEPMCGSEFQPVTDAHMAGKGGALHLICKDRWTAAEMTTK